MCSKNYVMKSDAVWVETVLVDGKSAYSDKTEEEYLNEGFLILSEDEMFKQIWANEDEKYIKEWSEISKEYWWEMLEVLPPMKWQHIGNYEFFFISEATTSNIHACYCKHKGKYYTASRRTDVDYSVFVDEINTQFGEK